MNDSTLTKISDKTHVTTQSKKEKVLPATEAKRGRHNLKEFIQAQKRRQKTLDRSDDILPEEPFLQVYAKPRNEQIEED